MVGSARREELGTAKTCPLCGDKFEVKTNRRGTFVLCSHCSYCSQSRNYKYLTSAEKKLYWKYNFRYYETYSDKKRGKFSNRKWRQSHLLDWRNLRNTAKKRAQEETQEFATMSHQPWDTSDSEYLRRMGQVLTMRELALDLGRSYTAVSVRASLEKIPLITEDKKHGRRVTGR